MYMRTISDNIPYMYPSVLIKVALLSRKCLFRYLTTTVAFWRPSVHCWLHSRFCPLYCWLHPSRCWLYRLLFGVSPARTSPLLLCPVSWVVVCLGLGLFYCCQRLFRVFIPVFLLMYWSIQLSERREGATG